MIRLRSQKLLSGVSGLAVMASLGVVSPALATTQTFTGSGLFPAIVVVATDTAITVDNNARIDVDGSGNSITNAALQNITGANDIITLDQGLLFGNLVNAGTLNSTAGDGITMINGSDINGAIINTGRILGTGLGIEIIDSTLVGGIQNNGATSRIIGAGGILFDGETVIKGGVTNAGTLAGTAGHGIDFQDATIDFQGNITNSSGGTISAAGGNAAINMELMSEFTGNIANTGLVLSAGASALGISLDSGTFTGNITNNAGGVISTTGADAVNISLTGTGTLTGNVNNSGRIIATGASATALLLDGALFTGEIQNNSTGTIDASGASGIAININTGTLTGGIDNDGTVSALGAGGQAIIVTADVFTGGISNTGTGMIQSNDTAIWIAIPTFAGGISNAGSILSQDNRGILIDATVGTFTGDVSNSTTGVIDAGTNGIEWIGGTLAGNVTNAGLILAPTNGILLNGTLLDGDVSNSGDIGLDSLVPAEQVNNGINFLTGTITGDMSNSGTIAANNDGIIIGGTLIGDLTNSGKIFGDFDDGGAGTGIEVNGLIQGSLINTGFIDPVTGINVTGSIVGGIFNTNGVIIGEQNGINLTGATGAHTVTQSGANALIQGGEGGEGTIGNALNMDNGFADTFNANGGAVDGNIVGGEGDGDNVLMDPTTTFAWFRGKGVDLNQFDSLGGIAILGATARGGVGDFGQGVQVEAITMTADGHVYLDDDTLVGANGGLTTLTQGATGILEWLLTTDTSTTGNIVTTTATLAGRGAVYIEAADFADQPNVVDFDTPITYQDVLDAGTLNGAFTNAGTLLSSSVFFTAEAVEDGANNIDIILTRLNLADGLNNAGAAETINQNAVGGALEDIYFGGEYGAQFEALFAFLFDGATTPAQIQAAFDEISGSEHAQIQGVALRSSQAFNDSLGMRLDGTLPSSLGLMADLGGRQYAQAAIAASDAGSGGPGGSHGLTRGGSGVSIWARGAGQWADVDGDQEASGYDQDTTGVSGGIDVAVSNNATLGLAGAWSTDDVDFDSPGDSADVDSWHVGGYGSVGFGRWYLDGLASYSSHDTDTTRTIAPPVPGAPFTALANYDSTTWSVNGEFGMVWRAGRVNVQPSVGVTYMNLSTDAFTETGNANAYQLIVSEADADSLASTLALRMSGQWMMGRTPVVPELRLGWRHEFENDPRSFTAVFNELNSPIFQIISSEVEEDSAVVRAGLTAGLTKNFEIFLNVNGQYSSDAAATNASGGLRVTW